MGLAVLLETSHARGQEFGNTLQPLAYFGLVHGIHEWFEMSLIYHNQITQSNEAEWVSYLRLVLLGVSFLFLVNFGSRLVLASQSNKRKWVLQGLISGFWLVGVIFVFAGEPVTRAQLIAADVYTRYSLAIPGATLSAWGLLVQRMRFRKIGLQKFGYSFTLASIAFALYGAIGQLFATPSSIFPSQVLNSTQFMVWFGIPIQAFRALMAILIAYAIIHSLRALTEERLRLALALEEAQQQQQQRMQKLRGELLHRTVRVQEQERERIARELHDETGQVLTALGMGLRGLSELVLSKPERAAQQARQLEILASAGIEGLQRIVGNLRPPQLDELGLLPALRWYAQETGQIMGIKIQLSGTLDEETISPEVRMTLFRIAQEAVTNIARHAKANTVEISLRDMDGFVYMRVEDDGVGFDSDATLNGEEMNCLGLMGMIERASLAGGECTILSSPGKGTLIEVNVERNRSEGE